MKTLISRSLIATVSLLTVLGCSTPQSPPTVTPAPVVVVTRTPTPSPSPVAVAAEQTPANADVYRLRVEFLDASDITFDVTLNGRKIGTFNTDAENDITPLVHAGGNEIGLTWTKSDKIDENARAQVYLESQRPGQDGWNSLFSREVSRKTAETSATGTFEVIDPAAASGTSTTLPASPSAPVETPLASPSPVSQVPAVKDHYSLKVEQSISVPTEFVVELNGTALGTFAGDADQDITDQIKPGSNTLKVSYKALGEIKSGLSESHLKVGMERDGKWSTVAAQSVRKPNLVGERSFQFVAR